MQLSLDKTNRLAEPLPSYPIADAIALLLILINFPSLLVTATLLLFSYKEHIAPSLVTTSTTPPLLLVLFIDVVVIFFSAMVLPSLRSIITNIAHAIVAISLTAAEWRITFPLAFGIATLQSFFVMLRSLRPSWNGSGLNSLGNLVHKLNSRMSMPSHSARFDYDATSIISSHTLSSIQSAVAMHVFSLGLVRLLQYYLSAEVPGEHRKDSEHGRLDELNKSTINPPPQIDLTIWDYLMRLRVEAGDRRCRVTCASTCTSTDRVWIAEISSQHLIFSFDVTTAGSHPQVEIHVNGLPWTGSPVPASVAQGNESKTWTLIIDNLSPKTEYEITLNFRSTENLGSVSFSVCTSAHDQNKAQTQRADSLKPLTQASVIKPVEHSPNDPSAPTSPVTNLEERVMALTAKLEEKRASTKRIRKENTKNLAALQREIEHISARGVVAADKHDHRVQSRMHCLQIETKRMQDAIDEMETQKFETAQLYDQQQPSWISEKRRREEQAEALEAVRKRYEEKKADYQKRISVAEADAGRIRSKADKLSLKRTRIQQDLDRLSAEQDQILNQEFLSRATAREALRNQRLQVESEWLKAIHETQQRTELLDLYGK